MTKSTTALTAAEWKLLLILAIIQFTHIVDFMIIMPLGAQFMDVFDISPQQFSFIVSVYAGAAFFAGLLSAVFVDRFDRKKALFILYIGFTIGTFVCSIASDYTFFLLARSGTGAFGGILSALVLSIVGDTIPFERRGRAMSIVMTAFSIASIVGVPLGIYLAAEQSWRTPFWVVGILSALVCLVILFILPNMTSHLDAERDKLPPLRALSDIAKDKNQLRALFFNVVLILGHFTIIPFITPFMQFNVGFSEYQIAYIYIIGGALTVVSLPLFGTFTDRFGHPQVFTFGSVMALGSIFFLTNLSTDSISLALLATSLYFVVSSSRNVPALTMITSVVPSERRGSFMSVRSSIQEASLALSSIIAGLFITEGEGNILIGYNQVGYFAMVMTVFAAILAWRLRTVD